MIDGGIFALLLLPPTRDPRFERRFSLLVLKFTYVNILEHTYLLLPSRYDVLKTLALGGLMQTDYSLAIIRKVQYVCSNVCANCLIKAAEVKEQNQRRKQGPRMIGMRI